MRCRYLIVSHPRSGSCYTAACFRAHGLDVGFEEMGRSGMSAWQCAVPDLRPYQGGPPRSRLEVDTLIHLVRDPLLCLSSNYYTERTMRDRAAHIPITGSPLEQHAWSIVGWNRLIRALKPDFTVGVEDLPRFMREQIGVRPTADLPPTNLNTRSVTRSQTPRQLFDQLGSRAQEALAEHATIYGYRLEVSA